MADYTYHTCTGEVYADPCGPGCEWLYLLWLTVLSIRAQVKSTLTLADLGGCEVIKKSMATGERLQEAVQINLGLLALKKVNRGAAYSHCTYCTQHTHHTHHTYRIHTHHTHHTH